MKRYATCILALFCAVASTTSVAEPTTERLKIVAVRPYNLASGAPGDVYIHVDKPSLCETDTYRIQLAWGGAKESVAAALTALVTEKDVLIEIDNAGCATPAWATNIQSIYLLR